jgi:hypothetical protein
VKALEAGDPAQIGKYRLLAVKLIRPDLAADIDFRVRFSRVITAGHQTLLGISYPSAGVSAVG